TWISKDSTLTPSSGLRLIALGWKCTRKQGRSKLRRGTPHSQAGQHARTQQPQPGHRVEAERRPKLHARGARGKDPVHLTRHLIRRAGEREAIEDFIWTL